MGYWPRPNLDDPKAVAGFWMYYYYHTTLVLLVSWPVPAVLAAVSLFRPAFRGLPEWRIRLLEVILGAALLVGALAFLRWDPHQVVEWYFD